MHYGYNFFLSNRVMIYNNKIKKLKTLHCCKIAFPLYDFVSQLVLKHESKK